MIESQQANDDVRDALRLFEEAQRSGPMSCPIDVSDRIVQLKNMASRHAQGFLSSQQIMVELQRMYKEYFDAIGIDPK